MSDETTKDPLSKIRHDLRTPINQIVGYSELLLEEAEDEGRDSTASDLGKIRDSAKRMLGLLEAAFANPDAHAAMKRSADAGGATPGGSEAPRFEMPTFSDQAETESRVEPDAHLSRLLVVDDNEMNRDMLARRLRSAGYEADTAEDGQTALSMIDRGFYDLLLLDVMMPGLSGIDVLKILRETRDMASLPVIMATAMDESHMIVEALKLGANDYVTKPLDFPVVLARTRTQLQLKKAQDELAIRNEFIRQTFGRYLSDDIVKSLLETPEGLKLGGENRKVTIMMTDVRGFTSLCERLAPESVVRILNNYLGEMAEIILKYQGTIDEFIGDAILTIFGAPNLHEDDAARAIACAIEMQLAMDTVNAFNESEGFPPLEMGVAINTGEVVVGNIGSEARAKYGVVGSPVNLTARIESYSIGGQILISETTYRDAMDVVEVGSELEINAKGLKEPMKAYDLRAIGGKYAQRLPERIETYKALAKPIVAMFAVLEGKHVGELEKVAEIFALSMTGAKVKSPETLARLDNLKIRIMGSGGSEIPADLYGKVTSVDDDGVALRFTSIPPEVGSFFKGVLARSAG